jgi:hypothetical protein
MKEKENGEHQVYICFYSQPTLFDAESFHNKKKSGLLIFAGAGKLLIISGKVR